ncbi:hypothetical protein ACEWY4_027708 [Coilia grayii]|uniref:G-protein coupled receptors family 2 profile 2 domain-containing protein n=1 Tax=Coilia grayii TaxID=363190 RepID=A0ABD1IR43_9TELE
MSPLDSVEPRASRVRRLLNVTPDSRPPARSLTSSRAKDPKPPDEGELGQDMGPSSLPSVPLMVGCGVSCTALLILLLIYAAYWRYIRSERSIILVNFCLSILSSNVLILVGQSQTLSKGLCTVTAAFLHFFFLASFCWVLTEAWQSYLAVLGNMRTQAHTQEIPLPGLGSAGSRSGSVCRLHTRTRIWNHQLLLVVVRGGSPLCVCGACGCHRAELESSGAGRIPVGTELESSGAGRIPVGTELESSGAGRIPVGTELDSSAVGRIPVGTELDSSAAGRIPVGTELDSSAAGRIPVGTELDSSAVGRIPVGTELESSGVGRIPVGTEL